jgi:hypothetical protein
LQTENQNEMKRLLFFIVGLSVVFVLGSCRKDENKDTTKPFIVVLGANPVYSDLDSTYTDAGAKAYDVQENGDTLDISKSLKVTDDINIHVKGTYKVHYNVSDAAGNKADEKNRTVIVEIF